jgi:hypothetical protein
VTVFFSLEPNGRSEKHYWFKAKEKYDVMIARIPGERCGCTCVASSFELPCKHIKKAKRLVEVLEAKHD